MSHNFANAAGRSALLMTVTCLLCSCTKTTEKIQLKSAQIVPQVTVVKVREGKLLSDMDIPGELRAFQNVPIFAKIEGFVSWIGVDRGSKLKVGEKMVTIFCPELEEHQKEEEEKFRASVSSLCRGQSALSSSRSKLLEAKARLDADLLTLQRLQATEAKFAGAVAQNEIDVQSKSVESDQARVASMQSEVAAAQAVVQSDRSDLAAARELANSVKSLKEYLTIKAPFDGIISERNVHVGSMVGSPTGEKEMPLLRIQEEKVLRLVVAVPEDFVASLKDGERIAFTVPAFPGSTFFGTLARPAFVIDVSTRTMPVELNVDNKNGKLEPGMFATVQWKVRRPTKTLFVPSTAVGTDLKGTFANLVKDGVLSRVKVQKGQPMGDLVEVVGSLKAGDEVALNASDELKSGSRLLAREVQQ